MSKKYLSLSFLNPSLSKTISRIFKNSQISKAFTLIEMMIVVVIIWIWLLGVISTLSYSYKFLFNTKNKINAINIARAWVEQVFSIRNTNWQRWWGKKDQCWLKVDPLVDEGTSGCENDTWFGTWNYVLSLTWNEQKYFTLIKQNTNLLTWGKIQNDDWNFLLCKNPDWILTNCNGATSKPANYFDTALYFQQVRWWYIKDKYNNTKLENCTDWDHCWDGTALEKNFCVDVVYFDGVKRFITFCSVLTNFKK